MSKINQIQNALKELDGGTFQKLAESYLHKKGYDQINCIGSVLGNNKVRKGTPDTLVALSNGKYTFAEHTTTFKGVCSKFSDDIDKCFDEDKTGIKTSEIEEIILCFTGRLTSEEQASLTRKCTEKNIKIKIFGISEISYDLLERYQSIALDHLGVEIDTGQIVDIKKFLKLYNTNKLTTSLSNKLYFRKDDKDLIKQSILDNDLTIISGQAGVGKSRLAVECYQELISSNSQLKAYCIFNKGIDLFNDIKTYFSDSGDYLIFVDDANRVSDFQYILQQLQDKRTDQSFKIIVTVRDYSLDQIKNSSKAYASLQECHIDKLKDEEITNILKEEFDIQNPLYLDRICHISDGNPRIAVMAAKIAKESNVISSINDVSQIYDSYFQSIKEDLEEFDEYQVIESAGVISYFRTIDLSDDKQLDLIESIFGISKANFKESCKSLHEMEVIDMYENEVVKISDQVLATYLFYLVFLKEQKLKFFPLVNELFSSYKHRLVDALNPALSAFDQKFITDRIKPDIDVAWSQKLTEGDDTIIPFMDVFWFIKPTETLLFVQNKINKGTDNERSVNYRNEFQLHAFVSVLSSFIHLSGDYTTMAIDLYFQYLNKFPESFLLIQDVFSKDFNFECNSHLYGYTVQKIVIDKLISTSKSSENTDYTKLFISTASSFSQTNYSSTRAGRGNTVTWREFSLSPTKELLSIRKSIFNYVIELFAKKPHKEQVIKYLFEFSIQNCRYKTAEIDKSDAETILPFILSSLDPANLAHCVISNNFYNKFKSTNLTCLNELKSKFGTPVYNLYDCIFTKFDNAEMRLNREDFIKYKSKKIAKITGCFAQGDFCEFFVGLTNVLIINKQNNSWQLEQGVQALLDNLTANNKAFYEVVLMQVLEKSKLYGLSVFHIVNNALSLLGKKRSFELLNSSEFENKALCINAIYANLKECDITEDDVDSLIDIFRSAPLDCFYTQLAHLKKYDKKKKGTFKNIIEIIIERASQNENLGRLLESLFNKHFFTLDELRENFNFDNSLIEKCYIYADKSSQNFDYKGEYLSKILDDNLSFITQYLSESGNEDGRRDDNRDYSFIWSRSDHPELLDLVNQHFLLREYRWGIYREFKTFYNKGVHSQANNEVTSIQDFYLQTMIENESDNDELMALFFDLICEFKKERKLKLYKKYLSLGKELDCFEKLRLYPSGMSDEGGSFVPVISRRKDFVQELSESCNSIALLQHRAYLEEETNNLRKEIQWYMKRDFTEDHF